MARWRRLSVILIGLFAFVLSAAVSLFVHMPEPHVPDEFGYLLAADTFAHGRLSNPTHPMWVHFESIYTIHQPTYTSKYPPAQGLMLAAGRVIGGHPIVGVWISTGLMCAAISWMLLAWLPPRWALLGGLLAVSHLGILFTWGQSYWGGAMAATGGALLFGALRRIMRRPGVRDALLLGTGFAILANSRPYEGLVVSLPVATALLVWMMGKNGPAVRVSLGHIVLPLLAVLTLTAGWVGFYNLRVTGNALRMPDQVHEATYSVAPNFLWQYPRPEPTYRHKKIRDYHRMWLSHYTRQCSVQQCSIPALVRTGVKRVTRLWKFYLGPLLTVPLVMLPWVLRNRWMRFALLICMGWLVAFFLTTWSHAYYAAPITGLVFALVLQAMRHLRLWRWCGKPIGRFIVRAIPLTCVTFLVLWLAYLLLGQKMRVPPQDVWSLQRARILAQLQEDEDRHLVVVRYGPEYSHYHLWVYNEADIDGAEVIWAREMDAAQNRKLLAYFKDRRVWLLADGEEPQLVPYPILGTEPGHNSVSRKAG